MSKSSWLLFIYKVPSEPARKRAYVWRRLNRMHALYLQQAVCILPDTKENEKALENLALQVKEFDGEATLLRTSAQNEKWKREIEARFEAGKTAMFEKLQEEIKKFIDEVHFEIHRKRFTVEEVEELEHKLEALERWFEKLKNQETKSPLIGLTTKALLKNAADELENFIERVEKSNRGEEKAKVARPDKSSKMKPKRKRLS